MRDFLCLELLFCVFDHLKHAFLFVSSLRLAPESSLSWAKYYINFLVWEFLHLEGDTNISSKLLQDFRLWFKILGEDCVVFT